MEDTRAAQSRCPMTRQNHFIQHGDPLLSMKAVNQCPTRPLSHGIKSRLDRAGMIRDLDHDSNGRLDEQIHHARDQDSLESSFLPQWNLSNSLEKCSWILGKT